MAYSLNYPEWPLVLSCLQTTPIKGGPTMSPRSLVRTIVALMFVPCALAGAVAQMPNPYGFSISLENAKKATLPALAEAAKNNWSMAVAVVDPAGNLVYYEKMDNTQLGSANVAIDKARSLPCSSGRRRRSRMHWRQVGTACAFSDCKAQRRLRAAFRS